MSCEYCKGDGGCSVEKFDAMHDSYYCGLSGEWLDELCGDDECRSCNNRPNRYGGGG